MKELVIGKVTDEQLQRIKDAWNEMIKAKTDQEWIPIRISEDEDNSN